MKQYRLLRNNKESGPYSAEELIQSGFKPYDLIWLEGRSAAWRYPGEIEEFKPYAPAVEEQPFDRFYKKPSAPELKKEATPVLKAAPSPASINPSSINAIPSVDVRAEKPRIRIKADTRKIEMPVASEPVVPKEKIKPVLHEERINPVFQKETINPAFENETKKIVQASTNPAWKDMWLDWEQEKKAVSVLNKISVKEQPEAPGTGFSQSFDDINESYVETVLIKPKGNSSISKSGNLITVFVLVATILGFGMWVGFKWSGKNNTITQQKMANIQPQPDKTLPQSPQNEEAREQILPAANDNAATSSPSSKEQDTNHVNQSTEHNTISVTTKSQPVRNTIENKSESKSVYEPKEKETVKNFIPSEESNDDALANKNTQENHVAENNVAPPTEKQDHPAEFNHFKPQPKITDFISVDTYAPSAVSAVGVKLHVQNISDIPVDMVMVDIHYYDANGKYQAGATIYVRNIGAGQTITVPAPDNSHAAKVDYRIAMVSSEKNNMYLIAD
jgi:hypothetical protein